MLATTVVLTFTVLVPVTFPPGPTDVKSYVVVACGETDWLPLAATAPIPLMLVSTVSVVCQVRVEDWPQLMFAVEELKLPVTGATAICALAIPTLNRGTSLSFSPRGQSTVFCMFLAMSTTTFLFATTFTSPDHTSLPLCVTVRWCVPGGSSKFWCQIQSKLNSSTCPTKYPGVLPLERTAARSSPFSSTSPHGPATVPPWVSSFTSSGVDLPDSMVTSWVEIL